MLCANIRSLGFPSFSCYACGHASINPRACLQPRLRSFSTQRLRPTMKLAHIAWAGMLLLASGAAAQDGDKAITKTTISLGTATPGGGFPLYGNAFAEVMNA